MGLFFVLSLSLLTSQMGSATPSELTTRIEQIRQSLQWEKDRLSSEITDSKEIIRLAEEVIKLEGAYRAYRDFLLSVDAKILELRQASGNTNTIITPKQVNEFIYNHFTTAQIVDLRMRKDSIENNRNRYQALAATLSEKLGDRNIDSIYLALRDKEIALRIVDMKLRRQSLIAEGKIRAYLPVDGYEMPSQLTAK